jgi:hypothetical protein
MGIFCSEQEDGRLVEVFCVGCGTTQDEIVVAYEDFISDKIVGDDCENCCMMKDKGWW